MALNLFYEKLLYTINVRTTNKKIVSKNKRLKKWIIKRLLCSFRNKNELKVKKNHHNEKLLSYYKNYKIKLNSIIMLVKNNSYKDKFNL
jgi:hypothetical protein